jgi:hypothetical protein
MRLYLGNELFWFVVLTDIVCCASLLGTPGLANAVDAKDSSYFCVAEFSGGLAYDESQKKWDGDKIPRQR